MSCFQSRSYDFPRWGSRTSGCFFYQDQIENQIPQLDVSVHATVLSTSSRTVITQTYVNPSQTEAISELFYTFPLHEGSSVARFTCKIGDKTVKGVVKPRQKAEEDYRKAKSAGKTAAIFHQSPKASDIFKTRIGNLPGGARVIVEITLVAELKQDAQINGLRYTVPTAIAPRYDPALNDNTYGDPYPHLGTSRWPGVMCRATETSISIVVDMTMEKGRDIQVIRSPSHPIDVTFGQTSRMTGSKLEPHCASVKTPRNFPMDRDFVITVNVNTRDLPCALLEQHPTLPNQRALMVSIIPKFKIPPDPSSEIILVIDRSGSMQDKIPMLRAALEVFLKSLPLGVHFNILSFGVKRSFLWKRSRICNEESLEEALKLSRETTANYGGTEILKALKAAVSKCYKDKAPDILLLTDGEIMDQDEVMTFVKEAHRTRSARFFTLGIGASVSHALIEGIAQVGCGFSQTLVDYEEMDKKVIRMLKGALTGRLRNVTLDFDIPIKMEEESEEFMEVDVPSSGREQIDGTERIPIPLFDENYTEPESVDKVHNPLPEHSVPNIIQVPTEISSLFPFIRSTMYALVSQEVTCLPSSITLRADSSSGPLEAKIPIEDVGKGETIHQLAAKRVMSELEQGLGWIYHARDAKNKLIVGKHASRADELVQKECERLGVRFQVAGKHCSFVAVNEDDEELILREETPSTVAEFPKGKSRLVPPNAPVFDRMKSLVARPPPAGSMQSTQGAMSRNHPGGNASSTSPEIFFCERSMSSQSVTPSSPFEGLACTAMAVVPDQAQRPPRTGSSLAPLAPRPGNPKHPNEQNALPVAKTKLQELVFLQKAAGHWEWSGELFQVLGLKKSKVERDLETLYKRFSGDPAVIWRQDVWRNTLATMLVLRILDAKVDRSDETWELLRDKAMRWVKGTSQAMDDGEEGVLEILTDEISLMDIPWY